MPKFSDLPSASRLDLDNDYLLINIRNGLNNYQTQKITGNDLIYSTCLPDQITALNNELLPLFEYCGGTQGIPDDINNLFSSIHALENEMNNLDSTSGGLTEEQANLLNNLNNSLDLYVLNQLPDLLDYSSTNSGTFHRIDNLESAINDLEDAISQVQGGSGGLTEEQENLLNQIILFESFSDDTGGSGVGPFIDNYNNLYDQIQNSNGGLTEEQANLLNQITLFGSFYDPTGVSSGVGPFIENYNNLYDRVENIESRTNELSAFDDFGDSGGGVADFLEHYNSLWENVNGFTQDYGDINGFLANYDNLWEDVNGFYVGGYDNVNGFLINYSNFYDETLNMQNALNDIQNNLNDLQDTDLQALNDMLYQLEYSSSSSGSNSLLRIDALENAIENTVQYDYGNHTLVYDSNNEGELVPIPNLYLNNNPVMAWDATNTCWKANDEVRGGETIIGFDSNEVYLYVSSDLPIHATFPVFINTPDGVWNTLNGGLVNSEL